MKEFRYSSGLLTLALALASASTPAFSSTLTVTNLADSGAGTLRDRIAAALPGDTIQFGVLGKITLGSELVIAKNLRIDGGAANLQRISANNNGRVFKIASGTAQIFNFTIADGRVAGTNGLAGINGENV